MRHLVTGFVLVAAFAALGCDNTLPSALLVPSQRNVTALVGDGQHVYWTTADGFLRRVPAGGGAVEEIAHGLVAPSRIALDEASVFWAENPGVIRSVAKEGGDPALLVENEDEMGALQVDDAHLYWLGPQQVRRAIKAPGAIPETIGKDTLDAGSLALEGALFYCGAAAGAFSTRQMATSGGAAFNGFPGIFHTVATSGSTLCAAGPDPNALASDPNSTLQAVTCGGVDGSNPHLVASGLTSIVAALAITDTTAYFASADGSLSAVALDGSGAVVASDTTGIVNSSDGTTSSTPSSSVSPVFVTGPAGGVSLAVDATSVYWAHAAGDGIYALPLF